MLITSPVGLAAPACLASALDTAKRTCSVAHDWQSRLGMIDIARVVRGMFPDAAEVVIDAEQRHVSPEGVQLAGILDHTGAVLWSATANEPTDTTDYVTADGHGWPAVQELIERRLSDVLGAASPDSIWPSCNHLSDALGHDTVAFADLYRAPLPSPDDVDAVLHPTPPSTTEQRRRARYYNRNSRHLRPTRDVELPAIRVAGAVVFVYVDPNRPRPTLRVSVDLDDVAPELQTLPEQAVALEIQVQGTPVFLSPLDDPPTPASGSADQNPGDANGQHR